MEVITADIITMATTEDFLEPRAMLLLETRTAVDTAPAAETETETDGGEAAGSTTRTTEREPGSRSSSRAGAA